MTECIVRGGKSRMMLRIGVSLAAIALASACARPRDSGERHADAKHHA